MAISLSHLVAKLRSALNTREVEIISNNGQYKEAGVLVPLIELKSNIHLLFTERSNKVIHHKGQISFPGGKVEKRDDHLIETVLRETEEEIGIKSHCIDIIGRLDDELTLVSGYLIHPFVGHMNTCTDIKPNPDEVESVFTVPLEFFLSVGPEPPYYPIPYEGNILESRAYVYQGKVIWGATCRILTKFVKILNSLL